jgi:hypothetical protein
LRRQHKKALIHFSLTLRRLIAALSGQNEGETAERQGLAAGYVCKGVSRMRKLMLLAGVAALTVAVPVLAQNDHGRGHGGGGPTAEKGHGNHGGGADNGQGKAERGRGGNDQAQATQRGRGSGQASGRGGGQDRRAARAATQERQVVRQAREDRRGSDRAIREARQDERQLRRDDRDWRGWSERRLVTAAPVALAPALRGRRLAVGPTGCPPGLARQNAYCMPPGQLRKAQLIGQRLPFSSLGYNIPERYRYRFMDNDQFIYRYGNDGTVYRFDRTSGLVSSVIPLSSSGLYFGEPMPLGYDVYNVPLAYRSYYPDSSDYLYRYDNGAIYRVNQDSMLVDGIVALLTGGSGGLGGLGVGDRLPLGYDAYNVPLDYRDSYYDTDDSMYRYADGYVYQVDPQTQLIEAVISLLT